MISEPQRTYILELITALGPVANGFVLAGAQAMKFHLQQARATRDFDFVVNVLALRKADVSVGTILRNLGYAPIAEARNFQFQKPIANSTEVMRIEFMAPEEHKRKNDFRVDIQNGLHARACEGGTIALTESDEHELRGNIPGGKPASANVRVVRPQALVMLKCLAMDERYRNIHGAAQYEHDRNEARIHAEDIVAILSAQVDPAGFRERFLQQFENYPELREKTLQIIRDYFEDNTKPGVLLYEERLRQRLDADGIQAEQVQREIEHAWRLVASLLS